MKTTVSVYEPNGYTEFSNFFRIPHTLVTTEDLTPHLAKDILGPWKDVCVQALELRIDALVTQVFKNRKNAIANPHAIYLKKDNNTISCIEIRSFHAMGRAVNNLQVRNYKALLEDKECVKELLKALYWIPEEWKEDQGGFGFGQLVSILTDSL